MTSRTIGAILAALLMLLAACTQLRHDVPPAASPLPVPAADPGTPAATAAAGIAQQWPELLTDPRSTVTLRLPEGTGSADALCRSIEEAFAQPNPQVDFTAARLAFAATGDYRPYNREEVGYFATVDPPLLKHDYETSLEYANRVLRRDCLSPDANLTATVAYEGLGQPEKAAFHRFVYQGVVLSVLGSGDGTSEQTARVVISTKEEYALLRMLEIDSTRQLLWRGKSRRYDIIEGVDRNTNQPVSLYFDVEIPLRWLDALTDLNSQLIASTATPGHP